jgi:hypothetical protein
MREHISYSELKVWSECTYKHKLKYIDKASLFEGNEFTLFGTALHDTCEKAIITGSVNPTDYFVHTFLKEVEGLRERGVSLDGGLLGAMEAQGRNLVPKVIPALDEYFGKYEVVSTEEMIYEPIEWSALKFKGYIDLILKVGDKYHIIDWKTCSWGWDARKKADKILSYQLTLYKYFFSQKHNIDLKDIETHFALLKRTAKKREVEIFRVTSGHRKIKNALNLLKRALYNVENKRQIKNRLSCGRCEFYKTVHCT